MKILQLSKSKMHLTDSTLTFDGIFSYAKETYMGLPWLEIGEMTFIGFGSKEDFEGQKIIFENTKPRLLALDKRCEMREKNIIGRMLNAVSFFFLVLKNAQVMREVDLVFAPYFEYCGFMLLAFRMAGGRGKVITDVITDYPSLNYAKRGSIVQKWYLLFHQHATYFLSDEVWFISKDLSEKYPTRKGIVVHNSSVEGRMVVPAKSISGQRRIRLAFVGRFADEKMPMVPALVLKLLKQQGCDAGLDFVGGGSLEDELRHVVSRLGLDDAVHFHGRIFERDTLFKLMDGCDMLILSSMKEGFPFVVLEAMSQGLMVLATAAGGTKEMIENGKNGFLFDPPESIKNADRLAGLMADRISRVMKNPSEYHVISQNAVETARNFTIERCGEIQRRRIEHLLQADK